MALAFDAAHRKATRTALLMLKKFSRSQPGRRAIFYYIFDKAQRTSALHVTISRRARLKLFKNKPLILRHLEASEFVGSDESPVGFGPQSRFCVGEVEYSANAQSYRFTIRNKRGRAGRKDLERGLTRIRPVGNWEVAKSKVDGAQAELDAAIQQSARLRYAGPDEDRQHLDRAQHVAHQIRMTFALAGGERVPLFDGTLRIDERVHSPEILGSLSRRIENYLALAAERAASAGQTRGEVLKSWAAPDRKLRPYGFQRDELLEEAVLVGVLDSLDAVRELQEQEQDVAEALQLLDDLALEVAEEREEIAAAQVVLAEAGVDVDWDPNTATEGDGADPEAPVSLYGGTVADDDVVEHVRFAKEQRHRVLDQAAALEPPTTDILAMQSLGMSPSMKAATMDVGAAVSMVTDLDEELDRTLAGETMILELELLEMQYQTAQTMAATAMRKLNAAGLQGTLSGASGARETHQKEVRQLQPHLNELLADIDRRFALIARAKRAVWLEQQALVRVDVDSLWHQLGTLLIGRDSLGDEVVDHYRVLKGVVSLGHSPDAFELQPAHLDAWLGDLAANHEALQQRLLSELEQPEEVSEDDPVPPVAQPEPASGGFVSFFARAVAVVDEKMQAFSDKLDVVVDGVAPEPWRDDSLTGPFQDQIRPLGRAQRVEAVNEALFTSMTRYAEILRVLVEPDKETGLVSVEHHAQTSLLASEVVGYAEQVQAALLKLKQVDPSGRVLRIFQLAVKEGVEWGFSNELKTLRSGSFEHGAVESTTEVLTLLLALRSHQSGVAPSTYFKGIAPEVLEVLDEETEKAHRGAAQVFEKLVDIKALYLDEALNNMVRAGKSHAARVGFDRLLREELAGAGDADVIKRIFDDVLALVADPDREEREELEARISADIEAIWPKLLKGDQVADLEATSDGPSLKMASLALRYIGLDFKPNADRATGHAKGARALSTARRRLKTKLVKQTASKLALAELLPYLAKRDASLAKQLTRLIATCGHGRPGEQVRDEISAFRQALKARLEADASGGYARALSWLESAKDGLLQLAQVEEARVRMRRGAEAVLERVGVRSLGLYDLQTSVTGDLHAQTHKMKRGRPIPDQKRLVFVPPPAPHEQDVEQERWELIVLKLKETDRLKPLREHLTSSDPRKRTAARQAYRDVFQGLQEVLRHRWDPVEL